MPQYQKLGDIPRKHHIWFHRNGSSNGGYKNEGIAYEHVITTEGFNEAYSIMYHIRPPTRVRRVELLKCEELKKVTDSPLRHHHLKTADIPRRGDVYTGRIPMLFNQDIVAYRCKPEKSYGYYEYYKNGGADEIIFVFKGGGVLESPFGKLPYRAEDYIVIPRGITYRLVPNDPKEEDYLILESNGPVRIPRRYLNHEGQIKMGSPYSERDFHAPTELITIDSGEDVEILVKDGPRLTKVVNAHHPFDVLGWDGYVYPFTFNAADFEPITGTVHQPPPIHQTFEIRGYVVCTFAPRLLDYHPEAVKIPWVHDNVEADEVLFYVRGNFGSRRGIEAGSITLHPRGIPHGPHPGTIMASKDALRTEELAVMFDTEHTLELTEQAVNLDDEKYPLSWLD
jgi:homogentisate 1,2-dioxygenase